MNEREIERRKRRNQARYQEYQAKREALLKQDEKPEPETFEEWLETLPPMIAAFIFAFTVVGGIVGIFLAIGFIVMGIGEIGEFIVKFSRLAWQGEL